MLRLPTRSFSQSLHRARLDGRITSVRPRQNHAPTINPLRSTPYITPPRISAPVLCVTSRRWMTSQPPPQPPPPSPPCKLDEEDEEDVDLDLFGDFQKVNDMEKARAALTEDQRDAILIAEINLQGGEWYNVGMYEEAEIAFSKVLEMLRMGYQTPDNVAIATALNNLGMVYANTGDYEDAEKSLKEAIELREQVYGAQNVALVSALNNLGLVYKRMDKFEESATQFRRALGIGGSCVAASTRNLTLTGILEANERTEAQKEGDGKHPLYGTTLNNLASVYAEQPSTQPAGDGVLDLLQRSLAYMSDDHPDKIVVLDNVLHQMIVVEQHAEAEPYALQLLALQEDEFGESAPELIPTLEKLQSIHAKLRPDSGEFSFSARLATLKAAPTDADATVEHQ